MTTSRETTSEDDPAPEGHGSPSEPRGTLEGVFRHDVLDRRHHPDMGGAPLAVPTGGSLRLVTRAAQAVLAFLAAGLIPKHGFRRGPHLRHVRQVEAADCGAACLATVLADFGVAVALKDLRRELGSGRGGVSAGAILRAARNRGLVARGVRADMKSLATLPRAAILHWDLNHFVVLERVGARTATVVDPAAGIRRIPLDEVARRFTGVALVFEGTRLAPVRPAGRDSRWSHVRPALKGHHLWRPILTAALVAQLLILSFPLLLKYALDHLIAFDDDDALRIVEIAIAPVFLVQLLVLSVRTVALSWLRARVDYRLSITTLNKLLSLPYAFLTKRNTGDLMLRVRSTSALRQVFTTTVLSGIIDGATSLALLVVVLAVDVRLALISLAAIAFQGVAVVLSWRRQQQLTTESLESQATSQSRLVEVLSGIQTVKLSGAHAATADAWAQLLAEETNTEISRSIAAGVTDGLLQTIRIATPVALLAAGVDQVLSGNATTGSMVAAVSLASALLVPVTTMMGTGFQMAMVRSHLDRLNDVLDEESEPTDGVEPPATPVPLEMRNVSFRYAGTTTDALTDVSLVIEEGTSVAIVGRSGSGKSTLAMLLAGAHEPTSGTVLLDGVDVRKVRPAFARDTIAVVPQHPHYFSGTIRDNITLFRDFPTDEIERVARVACVHDEILRRPMGYDSPVAERGGSLSGGQLQRIGLARALLLQPRVLVVDEATSALDRASEDQVIDNVFGLRMTIVFVTHREHLAARADRVVTIEGGRVVSDRKRP